MKISWSQRFISPQISPTLCLFNWDLKKGLLLRRKKIQLLQVATHRAELRPKTRHSAEDWTGHSSERSGKHQGQHASCSIQLAQRERLDTFGGNPWFFTQKYRGFLYKLPYQF